MGSAYIPMYHNYLLSLVSSANVVAVSVEYRLAPQHLLPAAYDDAHTALTWVLSRADPWLAEHGDYNRLFIAGDSAGANITSSLTLREGVNVEGVVLVHPYFWGSAPIESEVTDPLIRFGIDSAWRLVKSSDMTLDHPSINPVAEGAPSLAGLGCRRAMVVTAQMDVWVFRGRAYYGALKESGFAGEATAFETKGAAAVHGFHLANPGTEMAAELMDEIVAFINPV